MGNVYTSKALATHLSWLLPVCYALNTRNWIRLSWLEPGTSISDFCVLTTRLTYRSKRFRHQVQVSHAMFLALEEHLLPAPLIPRYLRPTTSDVCSNSEVSWLSSGVQLTQPLNGLWAITLQGDGAIWKYHWIILITFLKSFISNVCYTANQQQSYRCVGKVPKFVWFCWIFKILSN